MADGDKVLIYGKDSCPYTTRAREDYQRRGIPFEYLNVSKDSKLMSEMLHHSGGQRSVPVIVDHGKVTVGFGGA